MMDDPKPLDPVAEYYRYVKKRKMQEDPTPEQADPNARQPGMFERVGSAVARGVTEGVASMTDTLTEIGQGAINTVDKVATKLGAKEGVVRRMAWGDDADYFATAKASEWNTLSLQARGFKERFYEGQSWWEGAISGVTQFATGLIPGAGVGAIASRARSATTASKFLLSAGKGAVADFAAFDPDEARIVDWAENGPAPIRGTLGLLLSPTSRDYDDSQLEARLKQAAEGFILGGAVEGVLAGVKKIRAKRGLSKAGNAQAEATLQTEASAAKATDAATVETPTISVVRDEESGAFRIEGVELPENVPQVYATEAEAQSVASVAEAQALRATPKVLDDDTAMKIWSEFQSYENGAKDAKEVYEGLRATILKYTGDDLAASMENMVTAIGKFTDPAKATTSLEETVRLGQATAAVDGMDAVIARTQAARTQDFQRRADGFALKMFVYANADMAKHYANVLLYNPTNQLAHGELVKFLNNTTRAWQEFRREGTAFGQNLQSRKAKLDDLDRSIINAGEDADLPAEIDFRFDLKEGVEQEMFKDADGLASVMSDLGATIKEGATKAKKSKAKKPPKTPADGQSFQTPNRDLLPDLERELDDNGVATRWGDDLRTKESTPTSRNDTSASVGVSVSDRYKARIAKKIEAVEQALEKSKLPLKSDGRNTLIKSLQELKNADVADLLSQDQIDDVLLGNTQMPAGVRNPLSELASLLTQSEKELASIRNPKPKPAKPGPTNASMLLDDLEDDNPLVNKYWMNAQKAAKKAQYNQSYQKSLDDAAKKAEKAKNAKPVEKPFLMSRAELIHLARSISLYKEDPSRILNAMLGEVRIRNQADVLAKKGETDGLMKRMMGAIESYRVNSMLSGIPTTVLQTVSSVTQAALEPVAMIAGGVVAKDPKAVRFGVALANANMDVFLTTLSMGRKNPELWAHITEASKQAWQRGEGVLDRATTFDVKAYRAEEWGPVASIVNTPTRLLTTVDEFNKQLHYAAFVRAQAVMDHADLVKAGLAKAEDLPELLEAAQKNAYNLNGTGQAANPFALDWSRRNTFTTPLTEGSGWKKIQEVVQSKWILRQLMPFYRTPVNIYSEAMQYAPLVGAMSRRLREEIGSPDPLIRAAALGKQSIGLGLLGTVSTLVTAGLMTGNGPNHPVLRKQWEDAGNKPYTLKLPGGAEVQYQRLEPIATVMAVIADMAEMMGEVDELDAEAMVDTALGMVGGVLSSVQSKSFLSTLADFFDAVSNEGTMGTKAFSSMLGNYAGSYVPALVNNARKSFFDDEVKASYFDGSRNILNKIQQRVPGWSDSVEPRRNLLGDPVLIRPAGALQPMVWPLQAQFGKTDAVLDKLVKDRIAISPPNRTFGEKGTPAFVDLADADKYKRTVNGKPIRQSPYDRMQELLASPAINLRRMLEGVVMTEGYDRLPQFEKERRVRSIVSQAREVAFKLMLSEYPELSKATKVAKFYPLVNLTTQ